jgi:AraC-like DNA-binding protein
VTAGRDMQELVAAMKRAINTDQARPFSVYSSFKEQCILNAPIGKPLLICVLVGVKELGSKGEIVCPAQSFLFLPNTATIDMRNVPGDEYLALLIEFEHADFDQFRTRGRKEPQAVQGEIAPDLARTLTQYIEWSGYARPELWHFRRQELLGAIYLSGYEDVDCIAGRDSLSHQIHRIISESVSDDWTVERIASTLAVSPATLRRRIKAEETSIKAVVERARLGHALHLVQTTMEPIGRIAERCGYLSQSRFTDKFKRLFGVTPSELRRTRVP